MKLHIWHIRFSHQSNSYFIRAALKASVSFHKLKIFIFPLFLLIAHLKFYLRLINLSIREINSRYLML